MLGDPGQVNLAVREAERGHDRGEYSAQWTHYYFS